MIAPSHSVAVVGAGTMGAGIAQVAAAAGHPVLLFDVREGVVAKAIDDVHKNLQKLVAKGKLSAETAASARISSAASLDEIAPAKLVSEAVIEDLQAKREVFAKLDQIVDGSCLFATNTSSISITAIGAALSNPGRLAGMHFFNPAPLMELVEVVSGLGTDRGCAETIYATAKAWGKTPVHVKSSPGFIVNRVARPFYLEALRMVQERVATPATIDAVMREAGFRMGPFELMDLIGNDVNFAVSKSIFEAYFYEPRFRPSLLQQELVEAGRLGRKTGRGWYEYGENAPKPTPDPAPPVTLILGRILKAIAEEAQRAVDEGICTAEDLNLAMRKGVNYPQGPLEWVHKF